MAQKGRGQTQQQLDIGNARIGIVASRFNSFVVDKLITGSQQLLQQHSVGGERITLLRVSGAFELPLAARELADARMVDAIIALGVVIRGETAHFDYVCSQASGGLLRVSLDYGIALGFGLLTVDNEAQALARADEDENNHGRKAAQAALEMLTLQRTLRR